MNNKITFSELTSSLASRAMIGKTESETFLRELFALIANRLAEGENVKLKGLGTFKVQTTAPRRSIDVSSGREIEIPGYRKVVFTPDRSMADTVNLPFSAFETVELADGYDPGVEEDTVEPENDMPTESAAEVSIPEREPEPVEEHTSIVITGEEETDIVPEDYSPEHRDTGRRRFMQGFLCGVCSLVVLAAIGIGLWYMMTPGVLSSKTNSKAEPQRTTLASTTVQDTIVQDTIPLPPATKPSDVKVYDTISNTCFLTTMAKKHYGNYHLWPYIYDSNPNLGHPDRIRPGTRIRIPSVSELGIDPSDASVVAEAKRRGAAIYSQYK